MAHPYLFNNIELLKELAEKGKIDGIEINHNSANEEQRKVLLDIAKEYNLVITGGSDFHGLYNAVPSHIGSETTDEENIVKLNALIMSNSKK